MSAEQQALYETRILESEGNLLSIRNLRGRGSLRHPSRKVIVHHSRGNLLSI